MFVDEVKIKLIAGKGGDGCTSFRREKFIAMGGPNGGNGGKGASIIFKTDKSLKTLIDLKVKKIIKGDKGVNGKGDDRNGANAEDVIIKVPEGTVVTDLSTGNVIGDVPGTDSLSGILILEDVIRVCLKNHSCNLHNLIYRRFCRKHFSNII